MSKVSLLFLSVSMHLFCLKGQNYVQLNDSVECGASNHISIYGTYEDVKMLEGFLKDCSDLEYIRIKGFSSGEHWNHLFFFSNSAAFFSTSETTLSIISPVKTFSL